MKTHIHNEFCPIPCPMVGDIGPQTLIEVIVTAGLPLLSADEANRRVVELTMENIRLRAEVEKVELMKRYGA